MGILPLELPEAFSPDQPGLFGDETVDIPPLPEDFQPRGEIKICIRKGSGETIEFPVTVRLDTQSEVSAFHQGGILKRILSDYTPMQS